MKELILVMGFSEVGKSTLISKATERKGVESYHVATPFKGMLRALWGVDVDDREVRRNYYPNDRENVGELMASAFQKFREWDPDILLPGFRKTLGGFRVSAGDRYLLVDGVRTLAEVLTAQRFCTASEIPLTLVHVTRADVDSEKWPEITGSISIALDAAERAAKATGGKRWRVVNDEPNGVAWETQCNRTLDWILNEGTSTHTPQEAPGMETTYRYGYYLVPTLIARILPTGKVDMVYPVDPHSMLVGPGVVPNEDYWYRGKSWETWAEALSDLEDNIFGE